MLTGMKRSARQVRSRDFWEKAAAKAEASSERRADVARKLGVGQAALSYWIYKFRQERVGALATAPAKLVPVRLVESAGRHEARSDLTLSVREFTLRFSGEAAPEYVARVAAALSRC